MPRNKYPQETIDKILSVSSKLFVEKGYENTSIQDILDNLGGLTKGAIYHHFKSKEDIMLSVLEKQFHVHDARWLDVLRSNQNLTGLEKLRELFWISLSSPRQNDLFQSAPRLLENSKMLTLQMQSIMEETVPEWVEPLIREGMADGSICTDYPQELAEIIVLLINLWVTPMVFQGSREEIWRRVEFFKHLLGCLRVDFIDDKMMQSFRGLADAYYVHAKT